MARYFKPFWLVLLGFIFAIFSVQVHYCLFYKPIDVKETNSQLVSVSGVIEKQLGHDYFQVQLTQLEGNQIAWFRTIRANVSITSSHGSPPIGALFSASAKLKPYRSRRNFDNFNSELYAFTRHVQFKGKLSKLVVSKTTSLDSTRGYRQWLWQRVEHFKLSWLYYTLLSGDKSRIDYEDKQIMQRLGLSHMLAISGLHVGIVYGLFFYISKLLAFSLSFCFKASEQKRNINVLHTLNGLFFAGFYVFLSGFGVSAFRAFIMLSVLVAAYVYAWRVVNYRTLLFALCTVLLFDPFALLNPGLYFSFIAVYVIFAIANSSSNRLKSSHFLLRLLVLQLVLGVILAPVSSFYFYGVSLGSVFTNLIFIPLLTFLLLPALFLVLAFLYFNLNTHWYNFFDHTVNWVLEICTDTLANSGWLETIPFDWHFVVVFYLSLLLGVHFILWRWLAVIPILVAVGNSYLKPDIGWQIDIFDVGHGTSILVSQNGQTLLYDLGAKYFDSFSLFERVVQPYLQKYQLRLTHVILSHSDQDHIGGLKELLSYSGYAPLGKFHNSAPDSHCNIMSITMGKLTVESLWPLQVMNSDNNNSCVVRITDGKFSLLLAGDIEQEAERRLVELYDKKLRSDILLVPHHGSKTSSGQAFLQAVTPKVAIISRSFYSMWNLPHDSVVQRYKEQNTELFDTAYEGHIRIKISDSRMDIESARKMPRYWFL
ncbi:DNA internalization-related competence protein ComEC/Rec2 [Pseudoalteromonas byunsanensis]|uniref:DNA internalization-related competence protein ComEC/Rec2 n=1 Tax=Pseudoalteromonas byunsanensis TaxID=327939 RepID=A0A1S1NBF2_9GAMM|nr:DNA internalization-related competence protein ComEC/Rec2 [Pseudoalteromonas byunsanensis]